jgi:CubicO group peptidase (beta-lactamase class C family)
MDTIVASPFPLGTASLSELGFQEAPLQRLRELIAGHIAEGRYPGAQIALARHGRLALSETFGKAAIDAPRAASNETLWLLFSNTKVITAAGIWALVDEGAVTFSDRIADHIPEFAQHGKARSRSRSCSRIAGDFPARPYRRQAGPITLSCGAKSAISRWNGRRDHGSSITRERRWRSQQC